MYSRLIDKLFFSAEQLRELNRLFYDIEYKSAFPGAPTGDALSNEKSDYTPQDWRSTSPQVSTSTQSQTNNVESSTDIQLVEMYGTHDNKPLQAYCKKCNRFTQTVCFKRVSKNYFLNLFFINFIYGQRSSFIFFEKCTSSYLISQ